MRFSLSCADDCPQNAIGETAPIMASQPDQLLDETIRDATVMIVDDEETTVEAIRLFLEEIGYRKFVTCCDGPLAISTLTRNNPDIILLDLVMPGASGFEILTFLRADPRLQQLPVIILTASTCPETKLKALRLGATDLLSKPVDASELALRIQNCLASQMYREQLKQYSAMLEEQVRLRTNELKTAQEQLIQHLSQHGCESPTG